MTDPAFKQDRPFWETKRLTEMTDPEWESLCDGCGRCCLHKLRHEDDDSLSFTNVACRLLDLRACRCSRYETRAEIVPDCVRLTPRVVDEIDWLPPSCSYRRIAEGRGLAEWHHLVSGDPNTVHTARISVRGRAVSEETSGPLEDHIVDWPGRMPRVKRTG